MNNSVKILLAILAISVLIYFVVAKKDSPKENFAVDGAINGNLPLGDLVDNSSYDMIDDDIDTFADIVSPAQHEKEKFTSPLAEKVDLNTDYKDYLPDVNTNATSYDIDVTDPEVFIWRPTVRASIHNRQQSTADPYRGDLPITKTDCHSNSGWFVSRYNEGDAKLDGFFSEYSNEKYRALVGQKSYPQNVANEGTIMDYQPLNEMNMNWY